MREPGSGKPPYSLHEALQWIQKSVNECPQEFVWPCKRRNGSLFWAEVACSAKRIAGKRRILVVIRDITERKEVDRIKDEMLSAVSHEMRTPLTAMLGYLQFVLENRVEEAQMREYHGIMLKEAERLNKTINNFLDMQRLKAMQKSYNLKSLEVGRLLQEAADIFASPSDKHRIVVASHPDLPQIFGDEVLLHQMLNNLISNAIKYSANGSEITLGAKGSEKSVTIWIKDEGLGIPPESQEKIFEIFYRVDNTAKRKTTGTGLGLALVKEIVSAHGGQVWVESTVGMGSTFYIALPVVTDNTVLASQAI